ncbi:MAG TPA: ABC transporter ATP-binding protein [Thermoanaerobaculia bacterium]|nr:ABC transporter ATP-binding protein [Thermoanaerobaculia bacterium]
MIRHSLAASASPLAATPGSQPAAAQPGQPDQRPQTEAKIRLRGLRKAFDGKQVLDGLDLDVGAGESVVVIGASGTGKSVMLKHVVGLLRPDAGTVLVDGVAVERLDNRAITEFRRRFGMAFQEGALFDSMTVWENVAFPLRRLTRKSASQIRDRVEECLELVHLEGAGHKLPSELSGGMRRRVGFARAIAHEPEILLFDEPTTGLDPVTTAQVGEVIKDLSERLKTTTLSITHDMEIAFGIAGRIAMLDRGKIIAEAPPAEFRQLADPRVQQFIHGKAQGPLTEAPAEGGAGSGEASGFGRS